MDTHIIVNGLFALFQSSHMQEKKSEKKKKLVLLVIHNTETEW